MLKYNSFIFIMPTMGQDSYEIFDIHKLLILSALTLRSVLLRLAPWPVVMGARSHD